MSLLAGLSQQGDSIAAHNGDAAAHGGICRTSIVVAASDSDAKFKAQSDFVCDGVADHVEINAALALLGSNGGRIYLHAGNYSISAPIQWLPLVTIQGSSNRATVLNLADGANCSVFEYGAELDINSPQAFGGFQDFKIDGNLANQTRPYECHGISISPKSLVKKTITAATKASPCRLTITGHGFSENGRVFITGITGMTEINDRWFYVHIVDANNVTLYYDPRLTQAVNSSAFGNYVSGGTACGPARCYDIFLSNVFIRNCAGDGFVSADNYGTDITSCIIQGQNGFSVNVTGYAGGVASGGAILGGKLNGGSGVATSGGVRCLGRYLKLSAVEFPTPTSTLACLLYSYASVTGCSFIIAANSQAMLITGDGCAVVGNNFIMTDGASTVGVESTGAGNRISGNAFSTIPSTFSISYAAHQPADGQTIVFTDGRTSVTFEFDSNASVTAGNVAVTIGATADDTWTAFRVALAASRLPVTFTAINTTSDTVTGQSRLDNNNAVFAITLSAGLTSGGVTRSVSNVQLRPIKVSSSSVHVEDNTGCRDYNDYSLTVTPIATGATIVIGHNIGGIWTSAGLYVANAVVTPGNAATAAIPFSAVADGTKVTITGTSNFTAGTAYAFNVRVSLRSADVSIK